MELENQLNQNLKITENQTLAETVTEETQNKFLKTTLGKTINNAVDVGLKVVLPDMIEDQVIEVKNILLNQGLKEGIHTAIQSAINLGKSALGIVTGKFDNLSQVHTAIKKGGMIDSISDVITNTVNKAKDKGMMSKETAKLINNGKKAILDTVSNNLEEKYLGDVRSLEKVSKYIENWNQYYQTRDLDGMEKEYKKLKTKLADIVPLESTITMAKKIENIHQFLKNKGVGYELSEEEKQLVEKLL